MSSMNRAVNGETPEVVVVERVQGRTALAVGLLDGHPQGVDGLAGEVGAGIC